MEVKEIYGMIDRLEEELAAKGKQMSGGLSANLLECTDKLTHTIVSLNKMLMFKQADEGGFSGSSYMGQSGANRPMWNDSQARPIYSNGSWSGRSMRSRDNGMGQRIEQLEKELEELRQMQSN